MNYKDLRAIVGSQKSRFEMSAPRDSFEIPSGPKRSYIEPTFTKKEFEQERPRFLLITAVGASGKTALAHKLASDTGMPILDLGLHPPVGDNTLTGLLTTSFPLPRLSEILTSLTAGLFGVIVDGIDEGRSKVNEAAFNAFLNDLAKLSEGSPNTTFILLGRTQALIDSWVYLQEKQIPVGLLSIDPFGRDDAVRYIDTFSDPPSSGQLTHYREARDSILEMLQVAFSNDAPDYMRFIGYPPVLDAIATLLREEKNYYKLNEKLKRADGGGMEANLLFEIASYILERERTDKVVPGLLTGLLAEFPPTERAAIESRAYEPVEQSARIVSYILNLPFKLDVVPHPKLNEKYEEQLAVFLMEHPFLGGARKFQNAIFEAFCLAALIASGNRQYAELVNSYAASFRSNLYLVQMLNQIAPGCSVHPEIIHVLVGAALEFRSLDSNAEVTIEPAIATQSWQERAAVNEEIELELLIEILSAKSDEAETRIYFKSRVRNTAIISLGQRLSSCFVEVPCEVSMSGTEQLELAAPVDVRARKIALHSPTLIVKAQPNSSEKQVYLQTREVLSELISVHIEGGAEFCVSVSGSQQHHYPLVTYVRKAEMLLLADDGVREKYLKLRKILTHFRSHSRGSMAKLKAKVENDRVAGNEVGWPVLERLIQDGILVPEGSFYFLVAANVDKFLGVSWTRLREGEVKEKLIAYLRSIG